MTCKTPHSLPTPRRKWEHRPYVCDCGLLWRVVHRELGWNCDEQVWVQITVPSPPEALA